MATSVIMPALGMAQDTGRVLKWLKQPGERVEKGELLLEVETDKATVELEAAASGILSDIIAREGEEVPIGQEIAKILSPEEAATSQSQPPSQVETESAFVAPPVMPKAATRPEPTTVSSPPLATELPTSTPFRLLPASPRARRMLRERGIDLAAVKGTGPDGAVIEADVLAAYPAHVSPAISQTSNVGTIWRLMAERTTQSWVTTPHFYLQREVNATRLVTWRAAAQKRYEVKISYTDLLLKLTSFALRQHPRLNASWSNNAIVMNSEINIGIAVAISDGLVVPVIHRTDQLGLRELATQSKELVSRARAGKLTIEQVQGGTFTISNLGMYEVDSFNAIINAPQAAILAVGRIGDRIVPIGRRPTVQPMMTLTLSCDHRVVDGATAAEFLKSCADLIQEPLALLG